jgi:outer membrane protein TolC
MRNRIYLLSLLAFLLVGISSSWSQDTIYINEEELLSKLKGNNWDLRIAEQEYLSAKADFRQSNSLYLPQVELSYTAITTTNPLMAFGSKLNQEILTVQDFNPALLNDPDRTNNFATEISVNQPLINVDGMYQRKAAKAKMEAMEQKSIRTEKGMQLELKKSYMTLQLSYEALKVIEEGVNMAEEAVNMVEDFYEQGMVQKPDLLQAKLKLQELITQQSAAKHQIENASQHLAYLVNDSIGTAIYSPKDKLKSSIVSQELQSELPSNREDIQAMYKAAEAYESMSKASKMNFVPRLNAFGRYQLYDDEVFQADASGYLVGVQLSWSLFNGYQNIAKSEKSKIEFQKAQTEAEQYESQSKVEIDKMSRQLILSKQKVNQQELSVEQATEAYRIRKDRFGEGLEKTTDLLMAQNQLLREELGLLQAVFEFEITQEYLAFLTK